MGIYDKTCPQCMASSRATAARCACGYLFDSSGNDERSLTLERIAREEKLFEEYLKARLAQAQEAASVTAHAAELDPENRRKAIEASRAKQAAGRAAVGLATQRIKAAQAAHAAGLSSARRNSVMSDKGWSAKPPSLTPPSSVTSPKTPVNGITAHPVVTLRPKVRWTPKHSNNRTMPPLRTSNTAPHTQTGTSKFATAAGSTLSFSPTSVDSAANRNGNKPPIPVLTMAVSQQTLTAARVRNNGVKLFESKTVFDGSPWRDAAKKMAGKAAQRVARATARSAKKVAKGIGRAAASGAKKAGRAAARSASKAARHMAKAAAHTAKRAAHAVRQRRETLKIRAARTPPTLNLPPMARTRVPTLPATRPKPTLIASAPRSATNTTKAKPAAPKPTPLSAIAGQSPSPAKTASASTRSLEPKQRRQPSESFRAIQAAKIERAVTAAHRPERRVPASGIECALCSASLPANAEHCLCGWRVPNHEREIPALDLGKPTAVNGNELAVVFCPVECPLCSATIAANATHCRCGWRVPEGVNELPPVSLSSEEISALSQGAPLDELGKSR